MLYTFESKLPAQESAPKPFGIKRLQQTTVGFVLDARCLYVPAAEPLETSGSIL